jgi:predicted Holliday junction resolvase-like endonuclease
MKNAIIAIIAFVVAILCCCVLCFRLGVSKCEKSVAEQAVKVQQVVQENDRTIREKVLSTSHSDNLMFLLSSHKRAD